ncbi:MAG TPA: zinc ribbon domain-containing protein, partial [Anaerolineae bacterium]
MICPTCHFNNPDGFAFCGKCGAKLVASEPQPSLITDADLTRLRPYLTPTQLDALPPASLWRESDPAAANEQLIKLLET